MKPWDTRSSSLFADTALNHYNSLHLQSSIGAVPIRPTLAVVECRPINHILCVEVFDLLLTGVTLHKLLVTGLKAPAAETRELYTAIVC